MNPWMRMWIPLLVLTLGCSGKAGLRQDETQDARPVDKAQDAKAFATRGNEKLDRGDLDGAVADYTEAIRLDPRSARAYNNRALALYRKGDLSGALAGYEAALRISPLMAEAYYNRGVVRFQRKEPDEAGVDFNRAILIQPNYTAAYAGRGMVLQDKGEIQRAVQDYEKALQLAAPEWKQRGAVEMELRKIRESPQSPTTK